MQNYASIIAQELNIRPQQTEAVIRLLDEDATVPFIARYRKEATGSLDEVAVTAIRDRLAALKELDKRREAILASLEERGLLTPELRAKVEAADALTVLEDIYLPYRPKRRTRASMAKERGLEPLADQLARQDSTLPEAMAAAYVDAEKGVPDAEAALAGARDILAERFAEDQPARERLRKLFGREGLMRSKAVSGKEEVPDAAKYRDYFAWDEPAAQAPSHRILAMFRGEEEGFLRLSLRPRNEEQAQDLLARLFVRNDGPCGREVRAAALDGYGRLLAPALETELRNQLKQRADAESIRVFAENLRQLLLAPPLGAQNILAVDPGFRTGCKIVCLNREGKLLEYATINPHAGSDKARTEAGETLLRLAKKHGAEVAAVGNGTAGRETETFIRALPGWSIPVVMVSESGASVYSASEAARAEFPDLDLTYRGAVSTDEMSHHMTLQMVYIYHRDIERTGESLGKAYTHEKRAHQTRTTGEGYGRKIFLLDAGTRDGLINDWNHILLVGTGSQLRNNTAVSFVNLLRGGYIAQQHTILEHCGRGIIAAALYT